MQPIHRFQPSGVCGHIAPSHHSESHLQSEFGGSHDDESIDGESDGDESSNSDSNGDNGGDNGGNNDTNRLGDEFGDCSHGDEFDGVESLLLDENPISDNMFAPLYPGASVTICAAYCAIMKSCCTCKTEDM